MLIGDEKLFYEDQKSERIGRLSSDIDLKYVIEQEEKYLNEIDALGIEEEEYSFAIIETLDDESDFLNSTSITEGGDINQSHNRSGLTRSTKQTCDVSVQTDPVIIDKPKLRIKERVCTEDIKMTCANLSSICGLSVENSRLAVQTVCKYMYKHEFYLSQADVNTSCEVGDDPPRKRNCLDLTYVLPSARTISDFKQLQASQVERDAALALLAKVGPVKATLHYDTTSRNSIDGEWPSIISRFSDASEFVLRPMFFAYEDREQIVELSLKPLNDSQ